jgi:hypothetical protein
MGEIAFAVRADADDGFEGGALAVHDGDVFHLGEALEEGRGFVVVDEADHELVLRLDEQPALERVPLDRAEKAQTAKAAKAAKKEGDS